MLFRAMSLAVSARIELSKWDNTRDGNLGESRMRETLFLASWRFEPLLLNWIVAVNLIVMMIIFAIKTTASSTS